MAKGQFGVSMGGTLEYRYSLKPETKNCRNCNCYKLRGDPLLNERKSGYCCEFEMLITDCTNAKVCKAFKNRHCKKSVPKRKKGNGKRK